MIIPLVHHDFMLSGWTLHTALPSDYIRSYWKAQESVAWIAAKCR
jgi:hypothetical protein